MRTHFDICLCQRIVYDCACSKPTLFPLEPICTECRAKEFSYDSEGRYLDTESAE
jgi:hypothetical protein